MEIGLGDVEEPEQQLFDCCICSQCTPSTDERLVGLVTLLQPSNGIFSLMATIAVCTCLYFQLCTILSWKLLKQLDSHLIVNHCVMVL